MNTQKQSFLSKAVALLSLQERERKVFLAYEAEKKRLASIPKEERAAQLIDAKVVHSHKKNIFAFFLAALLITGLTDVWSKLYMVCTKMLQLIAMQEIAAQEVAVPTFIVFVILAFFITTFVVVGIVSYLRGMARLQKKILMLEKSLTN